MPAQPADPARLQSRSALGLQAGVHRSGGAPPEGLPLAYEVFAGNRADVTTVEDIVDRMEAQYGRAERIWAMDRGMTSEDNLDYLRARGALYIVGTPKSQLRQFERELLEEANWQQVEADVEVKLLAHPDGQEQFVLCRRRTRHEKEAVGLRIQKEKSRLEWTQHAQRGLLAVNQLQRTGPAKAMALVYPID